MLLGGHTYNRCSYVEVWEEFAQTKVANHPDTKWNEIKYWVPMRLANILFLVQRKEIIFTIRKGFSWGWAKPSKESWEQYIKPLVDQQLKKNKKYFKIIKSID